MIQDNYYWVWRKHNKRTFLKNPKKFTMKQANIMENFAEIFTNNQAKNINQTSDEIGKNLETVTANSSINKK